MLSSKPPSLIRSPDKGRRIRPSTYLTDQYFRRICELFGVVLDTRIWGRGNDELYIQFKLRRSELRTPQEVEWISKELSN